MTKSSERSAQLRRAAREYRARKRGKEKAISVYLPIELKEKFAAKASSSGKTYSELIAGWIEIPDVMLRHHTNDLRPQQIEVQVDLFPPEEAHLSDSTKIRLKRAAKKAGITEEKLIARWLDSMEAKS